MYELDPSPRGLRKGSRARWQSRLSHELLTWSSTYVDVPYLPCMLVLKHNFKATYIRTNSLSAVDLLVFTSCDVSLLPFLGREDGLHMEGEVGPGWPQNS